jgi:alpha-ketoglutarate-dependent taurine dioxygenase
MSYQEQLAGQINDRGYAIVRRVQPDTSLSELGRTLGVVENIEGIIHSTRISNVQILTPRTREQSTKHRYSGTFGLSDFPLHTDLAHWAIPPRYLALRCLVGSASVVSRLLPFSSVIQQVGDSTVRLALVAPRSLSKRGARCLLRIPIELGNAVGFRWDPLFLLPYNEEARIIAREFGNLSWQYSQVFEVALIERGDLLVLDNWRVLHGRSRISDDSLGRTIERVYLSELFL